MKSQDVTHSDIGILKVLSKPWIYELYSNLVLKKDTHCQIIKRHVKPFSGCRILDIGCGPGHIVAKLPDFIGAYIGFDMNESYIRAAQIRWKARGNCRFFHQRVRASTGIEAGSFDIVLSLGVLHHLDDQECLQLFETAYQALKPTGRLVTYDCVYADKQHWFAKWLIQRDRGKMVRTCDGYKRLAGHSFVNVQSRLVHNLLRVPYTIFIMDCVKE